MYGKSKLTSDYFQATYWSYYNRTLTNNKILAKKWLTSSVIQLLDLGGNGTILPANNIKRRRNRTLMPLTQSFTFEARQRSLTFRLNTPDGDTACTASPIQCRGDEGLAVWTGGTWSERARASSAVEINATSCHRGTIHLFNVPFPKWNPCNPADAATQPCMSPLWN